MWLVNVVDLCPGLLTMYCFAYQSISCTAFNGPAVQCYWHYHWTWP